jgi:citrate lyase beta subunit
VNYTEHETLPYRIGALMYVPALNTGVAEKVCGGAFTYLDTLALCLEDAISPQGVMEAEQQLVKTLSYIADHRPDSLPLIFVRVRDPAGLKRLPGLLGGTIELLTGVIFPKFDLANAAEYCSLLGNINANRTRPLYAMPILESHSIMDLSSRHRTLLGLREMLDGYTDFIINIRVGAMDFCNLYGLRRSITQTVYDIGVVNSVLTDILTVFADAYVVSAPVCEYYQSKDSDEKLQQNSSLIIAGDSPQARSETRNSAKSGLTSINDPWARCLAAELELDFANGFIGKTVVHPSQLPIVRRSLQPLRTDYEDAMQILNWNGGAWGVARSVDGNRMNEVATHCKWARKILIMSEVYGVKDS